MRHEAAMWGGGSDAPGTSCRSAGSPWAAALRRRIQFRRASRVASATLSNLGCIWSPSSTTPVSQLSASPSPVSSRIARLLSNQGPLISSQRNGGIWHVRDPRHPGPERDCGSKGHCCGKVAQEPGKRVADWRTDRLQDPAAVLPLDFGDVGEVHVAREERDSLRGGPAFAVGDLGGEAGHVLKAALERCPMFKVHGQAQPFTEPCLAASSFARWRELRPRIPRGADPWAAETAVTCRSAGGGNRRASARRATQAPQGRASARCSGSSLRAARESTTIRRT